jgi:hypothetical protein
VTGLELVSFSSLLPSASAWDTPDIQWKNRTLDPFYNTHPLWTRSHFMDFMATTLPLQTPSQWWTRQSMRISSSNQGHVTAKDIRTKIYLSTTYHTLPWTAPKPYQKRKESPCLGISSSNKSCRYTKPPVQTFITSSLLHPSKAHRICSVKMAGYPWKDLFEIFLQLF